MWLGTLLLERSEDIYRMKGLLSVQGMDERFVFQVSLMAYILVLLVSENSWFWMAQNDLICLISSHFLFQVEWNDSFIVVTALY